MRKEIEMKRIVFLNTSILTVHGKFEYRPTTVADCQKLLTDSIGNGNEILSAIGHESTANIMSDLLVYRVEMNRIVYKQEKDDTCIVFKMRGRPPEGKILSFEEIEKIGYDFGILEMIPD